MKAGFALDMKASGFGLMPLAYHATAVYSDPVTDNLYLVLDQDSEPTNTLLPVASTAPTPDDKTIYQFNGGTSSMVYVWKSKLYMLSRPKSFVFAKVRAQSYNNTVFEFYKQVYSPVYQVWQDILVRALAVESEAVFKLPLSTDYPRCWWRVYSTDQIEHVQVVEDIAEVT